MGDSRLEKTEFGEQEKYYSLSSLDYRPQGAGDVGTTAASLNIVGPIKTSAM